MKKYGKIVSKNIKQLKNFIKLTFNPYKALNKQKEVQ